MDLFTRDTLGQVKTLIKLYFTHHFFWVRKRQLIEDIYHTRKFQILIERLDENNYIYLGFMFWLSILGLKVIIWLREFNNRICTYNITVLVSGLRI